MPKSLKTAVFGGGCFWCTEAVFSQLEGVRSVTPGYSGGHMENPTYEQVSQGTTGHAEAIWIEYDPGKLSYKQLLAVFFSTHDPTQLNRQGPDRGEQYRSVIFYTDDEQKQQAEEYIKKLEHEGVFEDKIVTQLELFEKFYQAEEHHQNYYEKNQDQPYCQLNINPKLNKLRKEYADLLEETSHE